MNINEENVEFITLEISHSSGVPIYKQIAESIISKIEKGRIRYGQKLPSINQLSTYYLLSRDTVEKAYNELKEKKVIKSVRGLGYYVKNSLPQSQLKVLVLFNKLSSYKKEIYNAIAHGLKDRAAIDFFVYHCDMTIFKQILIEHCQDYHYYIIMPHFTDYNPAELKKIIKKIPDEKLIIIDNRLPDINNAFGCIYQNFMEDIYTTMIKMEDHLKKYNKLILVFPDNNTYPYPREIIQGFTKFCNFKSFNCEIITYVTSDYQVEKGTAYLIISETDLSNLIKLIRHTDFEIGKDVGIVSYNDTVLKEVLESGITVMSTDFQKMGELTAQIIVKNQPLVHKNDFNLIFRNSL
jgi:DNA-binding transcriptional regulator YhcF (GntR family)